MNLRGSCRPTARDAFEGKGPQRRPEEWLGRRLEEVAEAVGGGYCRLQMPLRLALGVRGTVAGHRLGALKGGYPPRLPMHPCPRPHPEAPVFLFTAHQVHQMVGGCRIRVAGFLASGHVLPPPDASPTAAPAGRAALWQAGRRTAMGCSAWHRMSADGPHRLRLKALGHATCEQPCPWDLLSAMAASPGKWPGSEVHRGSLSDPARPLPENKIIDGRRPGCYLHFPVGTACVW